MAVYKNYINKFYSQRGNRWDLEIWSRSDSSLDSVEFSTGKGGFKISYKGGDDRQDIIMPSEVTIPFIVKNADDQAFINGLLTADDKEYLLVIRRNFVIFWFGNLNAGFDSKQNDHYPYITTLKANDFLGEMVNNKSYTTIAQTTTTLSSHTTSYYNDIAQLQVWDDDIFPLGNDEKVIKTNFQWTAPNMFSYSDNTSKINQFIVNPLGFVNDSNYINKYKLSDTCKEVLKAFGLKMFMADGIMYCLQPYNYVENLVKFQKYTNSDAGALLPISNEEIDNRQNANNDIDSSTDADDGFQLKEWILEPANFTDSIWQANGSCTSITSNSFNVAVNTSNLYIDLAEGEYCLSYSENDLSVYIAKEEGGTVTSLLTESGHKNFSIGASGGELRVYTSVAGTLSVEHISLQKGAFTHRSFLAGTSFRYDRPISTATATFPFGQSSAQAISNFPNTGDTNTTESIYTTIQSIGALSTASSELIQINFNVFYGERFDYNAGNALNHIGGVLELKLKIGSQYLTGVLGNFSWTTLDSTFTLNIPIVPTINGTAGMFWSQTMEPYCQSYIPQLGDNYYFGIPGGAGSTAFIGANFGTTLPNLSAGGDVQLQFVNGTINYYLNPDTSNPNVAPTPLTLTKNNLTTKWFTGSPFSYGVNAGVPQPFNITSGIEQNQQTGIEFSASTELNNYKTVDLGNVNLGISGDETTHINCIKILNSSVQYEVPSYLQVDNTGTQYNMTRLLLEQYLEPQIEPLEIIQGDYYLNDFSAFKSIILDGNKYVFFEGSLNAEDDIVSGSWYKIAESTETITTDEEDVIYIEDDTPPPPPPPNPHDPVTPHNIYQNIINNHNWIKYNSIGVSGIAINSADTKIDLKNNSRAKLYTGQKLIFAKPDLSYPVILTKDGDSDTTATQIDVGSFSPVVTYPAGSILAIAEFDLTNVITGGGSTLANLYQGITTTSITLAANEFHITNSTSFNMYSRDSVGSVQPTAFVSRSKIYATCFVPLGYEVTDVDIYASVNRNIQVLTSKTINDSTTSRGTGTSNTTLTLATAWESVADNYLILSFEQGASTDEIYGAKITIAAV